MNVEGVDRKRRLSLSETVEINVSHDEARRTAIGVFENPIEVALDRNGRPAQPVEHGNTLRLSRDSPGQIVGLGNSF